MIGQRFRREDDSLRVGDVVHYVSYGTPGGEYTSLCRAAIVAATTSEPEYLELAVINPTGLFFNTCREGSSASLAIGQPAPGGTWHRREECDQ